MCAQSRLYVLYSIVMKGIQMMVPTDLKVSITLCLSMYYVVIIGKWSTVEQYLYLKGKSVFQILYYKMAHYNILILVLQVSPQGLQEWKRDSSDHLQWDCNRKIQWTAFHTCLLPTSPAIVVLPCQLHPPLLIDPPTPCYSGAQYRPRSPVRARRSSALPERISVHGRYKLYNGWSEHT